jgi:glyoxylase-like metal-dependent hydrolase (beta-lactamase superfamily II)
MADSALTRRAALIGGSAASAAALGLAPGAADARAPLATTQVPYFYRCPIGQFQATVVSDGPLGLGAPEGAFKGLPKDDIAKMLAGNFLPPDNVVLEQNVLVLNTGSQLALFDSGMGANRMFGTTTGRLIRSLAEARISPRAIDAIIISHGHIDHVGGLVDARGRKLFPNAQVYITKADYDFWTDEGKLKNDALKAFVQHARTNLLPYRDRLRFIEDGKEVIPGVQAIATPGHTVGHTAFMITSGGQSACAIGDLGHHQILSIERPRLEFAYDSDPKAAVASRLKLLDMLAGQRVPLIAYHFPWPGHGHVSKQGDSFRYHPAPMQIVQVPKKA